MIEPKKRGRPRTHKDNAVKQQAYYRRKQMEERITLVEFLFRTYKRQISRENIGQWTLRKLRYRWKHDRPRQLRGSWKESAREAVEQWKASRNPKNIVISHSEPNASIPTANES